MALTDTGTILELVGIGIPFYSARGLHQTLVPIKQASESDRDVNGALCDLSNPNFRKYASKISCTDQTVPAIDGVWPGDTVTVWCVAQLSYPVGGMPQRPEVSGSSYIQNGFTFYRPVLEMMIKDISSTVDEWGAEISWSIDLEEI